MCSIMGRKPQFMQKASVFDFTKDNVTEVTTVIKITKRREYTSKLLTMPSYGTAPES